MNKPNINVGEILRKLSFLKNNLGLLVPIVITVVALLLFIPTRLLSGRLRATVEQGSVRMAQQISSLTRQLRGAAPADTMEAYIEAYARDVNQIETAMTHTVYRELLRYDLFQDSNQTSQWPFQQFGQVYRAGVESMLAGLQPGACPTDAEIKMALDSAPRIVPGMGLGREADYRSLGVATPYGARAGMQWSPQMMTEVQRGIFEEICTSAAKAAKVYASASDIAGYTAWDEWKFENRDQAFKECWAWQMGYWIVEDVVATVRAMNEGASNVLDAPVKRLMNVSFKAQQAGMVIGPRRGGRRRRTAGEYPAFVKDKTEAMTTPCTGRFTDETKGIDVIHFEVRVVVDESQVLPFIRQLCSAKEHKFYGFDGSQPEQTYQHNQITVLEVTAAPIEPLHFSHQSYRYGPNPAMELYLICEYALPRAPAFEEIKPQQVKDELAGVEEETQ